MDYYIIILDYNNLIVFQTIMFLTIYLLYIYFMTEVNFFNIIFMFKCEKCLNLPHVSDCIFYDITLYCII